jgi:mono/diheme cytochrome c family protein
MCAAAIFAAGWMTAGAQTTTSPVASQEGASADQAQADEGKKTYAEKCSHCHGPGMLNAGTITPDLRKFPDDKERFFTIVKQGRNNKMPPWADLLSDDQIGTLWSYISSRRKP